MDSRISDKLLVRQTIDKNYQALENLNERLNKAITFLFDTSLFDTALNVLQRANDDYQKIYDMGSQFADLPTLGIRQASNIDFLRQLQSSTGVFNVVFQRMFQSGSRSLLFFIIALMFDFALVLLASLGYQISKRRSALLRFSEKFVRDLDVRYLWIPPRVDGVSKARRRDA